MIARSTARRLLLASVALGGLALGAGGARAADATATGAAQTAESSEPGTGIGQVVVTARKRSESLQRVPLAITAQTGQQLTQQRITQPTDLPRIVPSLQIGLAAGADQGAVITLRGQAAGDTLLGVSQPVGLYQDTVNIPHPFGSNTAFFDLARVEVLKGPQGTLYGRNTTGGAINIITNTADYRGFHGFLEGEAGNHSEWKVGGAVNIPIIADKLALRIGYQHWNQQGYGRSLTTGQHQGGDHNDDIFRAHLRFDPTSNFTADLEIEYSQLRHTAPLIVANYLNPDPAASFYPLASAAYLANPAANTLLIGLAELGLLAPAFGTTATPAQISALAAVGAAGNAYLAPCIYGGAGHTGSFFTNCAGSTQFDNLHEWHGALDMKWSITDNISLRSITGLHSFTDFKVFDLDAVPMQLLEVGIGSNGTHPDVPGQKPLPFPLQPDQQSTQWTQEFDLQGKSFNGALDWLVGGFMSWDDGKGSQESMNAVELTYALSFIGFGNGAPPISDHDGLKNTTNTWAIYTQEDFHFNRMISLTVGGRYTSEDISQILANWNYDATAGFYYCNGIPTQLPPVPNVPGSCATLPDATGPGGSFQHAHSTGWSYLASLNFQLTNDILLYIKTSRGFRGGAFGRSYQVPAKPETDVDYEIGLKSDFFHHRLRVNVDAYTTDYNNKQVSTEVCSGGSLPTALGCPNGQTTSTLLLNAATARIRGVEFETTAIPFEGLSVFVEGSFTDATYVKFPNAITNAGALVDATGQNMAVQPRWQGDVGGRYEHPLGPGVIGLQADYSIRGALPINNLTRDAIEPIALQRQIAGFVGLVNARIDFHIPDQGLTFALWGTNLGNRKWAFQSLPSAFTGGMGTILPQAPLMFGFSVRKAFGRE